MMAQSSQKSYFPVQVKKNIFSLNRCLMLISPRESTQATKYKKLAHLKIIKIKAKSDRNQREIVSTKLNFF